MISNVAPLSCQILSVEFKHKFYHLFIIFQVLALHLYEDSQQEVSDLTNSDN